MTTARIFISGNSQAVRLPKEFRFDVNEVEIFRRGDEVVLKAPQPNAIEVFNLLRQLPAEYLSEGRQDEAPQDRESL
ncbi:MAG: antitoxin [Fluviibacter sp.]